MKIFKYVIIAVIAIGFSGCWWDKPKPSCKCETKYVYKYKIKEVKVPVKLHVPEVKCDFKGDGFEPTIKLLECIVKQKKVLEAISSGKYDENITIE